MKYQHLRRAPRSKAASRSRADLTYRATPAESKLMAALDAAREPYRFQYTIRTAEATGGFFVVDFYLPRRKLLVELDGSPHTSERRRWNDRLRGEAIQCARPDCLLTRFWNSEVVRDPAALVRFLQTY